MNAAARLLPLTATAPGTNLGRWPAAFAPRFFLALILGLVWLGPAWWEPRFVYVMVLWDALVMVAWVADLRRLPPPARLEISRLWSEPISQGVEGLVQLEAYNRGMIPIQISLQDDVPSGLHPEPLRLEMSVPAAESVRATYSLRPTERGDARLGRVFLRYRSSLKFAERWATAELIQTVRVYPNLQESKRHTLYLIRSRQIELEKRLQHRPERGREFESLREYRPGDEPRDICWTATARRGKLITKVYQAERSQTVVIVVDAGRLMLARTGKLTKLDVAVTAALTLAQVALYSGDYVGLLAYGRELQARLAPARGSAHLRACLDQLAQVRGELVEADHAHAADTLLTRQRRRSLIVWLTDLAETAATPEVIEGAARLLPHHLVVFAAIGQPELDLFVERRPTSVSETFRYVAALEMIQRRDLLLRRLRQQGAVALELAPGQVAIALVNQYLKIKEQSLL
jgi:uncharacterized protein (DUF58 family)